MLLTILSTVVGENHYYCACQQSSGSSTLVDGNTRQCCTAQGGSFPSKEDPNFYMTTCSILTSFLAYQDVTKQGVEVSYSGNYVSYLFSHPS